MVNLKTFVENRNFNHIIVECFNVGSVNRFLDPSITQLSAGQSFFVPSHVVMVSWFFISFSRVFLSYSIELIIVIILSVFCNCRSLVHW